MRYIGVRLYVRFNVSSKSDVYIILLDLLNFGLKYYYDK